MLLYDLTAINTDASTKTWNMALFMVTFSDPNTYDFVVSASLYGPSFSSKCFLGYNSIFYEGFHNIDFSFTNTSTGNYSNMNFNSDSPTRQYGYAFCFGNET